MRTVSSSALALLVVLLSGCAPSAKFAKLQSLTAEDRLVVFPALAPADVSSIATPALEQELTKQGHEFVSSNDVKKAIADGDLLDGYRKFVESYNELGLVDRDFLARFSDLGTHFLLVRVTDWAQGENFLIGKKRSGEKVDKGETLVAFSASLYDADGTLLYADDSRSSLSDPFKTPSYEKVATMAAWKIAKTLPKRAP